jgi:CubicO group peptidase (beta-lactamase class C family)
MDARLKQAYDVLGQAVDTGAFPGGVLAVGYRDAVAIHPFGRFTYEKTSRTVDADTMYDLASVTKVVATTTSTMLLEENQRIDINLPVSRYLPEFLNASAKDPNPTWRGKITLRNLLLHDSGLPPFQKYFEEVDGKEKVIARVLAEPLVYEPGTKVEYSDLGFMLLGTIVERVTGQDLDAFAKDNIFEPLGMKHTMYTPPKSLRKLIPPEEKNAEGREGVIQGEVHDGNAFAMDGVSGHAGLFSTAGDLAIFAQMMLNGGIYAQDRLLERSTIDEFTTRVPIGNSARALGWDVPVAPSSSGDYFSQRSFGHTGFTGTSIWIDPEKQLFVILLTNRVYPTRENIKIRQVRPILHDAVVEGLGLTAGRAAAH